MANSRVFALIMVTTLVASTAAYAGLEESMAISASGVKTQIFRQQIMAENVANVSTMKGDDGQPYRRKIAVLQASPTGVRVAGVMKDPRPFTLVYDPSNPLADEKGFVKQPNVTITTEMVDLSYSSVLLEANANAYNVSKGMYQTALELVK